MSASGGPAVIAVDVGGTTSAVARVTETGAVSHERQAPTHAAGSGTALAAIESLIESVRRAGEAIAIGVGVPAIVHAGGIIGEEAHNVPELAGAHLAEHLSRTFGLPAFVDNDVNALTLGEWRFGIGRDVSSFVMLAAGTGLGSGIVIDGRIVRGSRGFGAELGHVPVKFDGKPCWCGGRGCLVLYASGRGIAEAAGGRGDAAFVFERAAAGEPWATAIIDDAVDALGAMLGIVVNGLNPEAIVITGGVATSFATLEARVLAAAGAYAFRRALAATRITIVPDDKRSSMRGAGALAFYELGQRRSA